MSTAKRLLGYFIPFLIICGCLDVLRLIPLQGVIKWGMFVFVCLALSGVALLVEYGQPN